MREQSDGNEIDAGLGIGANIFQANSARAFEGDAAAVFLHVRCEQRSTARPTSSADMLSSRMASAPLASASFQFFEGAHFHFDGLRSTAVAHGPVRARERSHLPAQCGCS